MALALPGDADEWIDAWGEKLNESEAYGEAGAGWGVGFNGDFLFHIRPDETYDGADLYFFVGLEDGVCTDAMRTDDPDGVDWGFAFRCAYGTWKQLLRGELGAIDGLMSGAFELDGDMQRTLQYSDAAVVMTEEAAAIDTAFEYWPGDRVLRLGIVRRT
ncbi:SCP2 sterol-binding domain-containing protein [Halorientalis sp.]|uniref:SCP2 sterol-binding domain-containing protein n=1 Tax=Halorientalis sp. TaxID=1931229 RepID=UPI002604889A|nr:SCP2 sterol-binding domain-containing protein [Halorientalis sp.]